MRAQSPPAVRTGTPLLAALALLFVGSGCAALIYQVVWLQLLQLVIGSSAVSLGVLLAAFMGGMCLGSFLLPRIVDRGYHPLKVYAALEIGIGVAGLLLLHGMPLINSLYMVTGGGVLFRAIVAAVCLVPPTAMMGATLPAVARWVDTTARGVAWLGLFYGGNIAGAVLGTLVAGFYLLPEHDMAIATYVAVAINVSVAMVSVVLASRTADVRPSPRAAGASPAPGVPAVYVAIALSGFTALAAEVIWTRLLSLIVGATVYAFALILAAFLAGLGIGSSLGAVLARRVRQPRLLLAMCQILLCGAIGWAAHMIAESLPYWTLPLSSFPPAYTLFDLRRCAVAVLPGAILWGASFPIALAAVASGAHDPARLVGGVYAANTIGAIAGALVAVFLSATIGSQHAQQLLIVIAAVSGAMLLAPMVMRPASLRRFAPGLALVAAIVGAAIVVWRVPSVPPVVVAYGRNAASWSTSGADFSEIVYAGEGLNTFVAVSRSPTGAPIYHAAGKVQASSEGEDMRLQRMLAHFSHLMARQPRNVMVIGLGAGFTAGAVAIAPDVERMTIVEIEPIVPSLSRFFADYNYRVAENPKVSIRIDDARHALLTTQEKFDVITSDLVDPWVKGTAALFTREFFESVKQHLTPGGVVTLFVQLYLSGADTVKSEIATFMEVFPNAVVWGNTMEGQGYDLVLTGQVEPFTVDVDALQARLDRPDHAPVAESLREIGFGSAVDLLSTYAGSREDLEPWLHDAVINRDRNLRLQYLAGTGIDLQRSGAIYAEMVHRTRFPNGKFHGSPASIRAVRDGIERALARAGTGLARREDRAPRR